MASLRQRIVGMFLGIGIGDALGMAVETFSAADIKARWGRVTEYMDMPTDHKWHHDKKAGETTDDTQLTLAVARAFVNSDGNFEMDEIARQHVVELYRDHSTWGGSTREAVKRLNAGVHWSRAGKTDDPKSGKGNGVVMKLAPLAAYRLAKDIGLDTSSVEDSLSDRFDDKLRAFTFMTHWTGTALAASRVHVKALMEVLKAGDSRTGKFLIRFCPSVAAGCGVSDGPVDDRGQDVFDAVMACRDAQIRPLSDEAILEMFPNTFLVHQTLGLAYACFLRKSDSIEAMYDAVNMGGDADSTGSIVGSMLGAMHGPDIFPKHLVDGLLNRDEIIYIANRLCDTLGIPK